MSGRVRHRGGAAEANPFLDEREDVNPSQYLTNLADCMLVLAVGFMVALVAAYNVDLPSVAEVQDMTEISDVEKIAEQMTESGTSYNRLGEVYQDPETGKIYMIAEEGTEGAAAAEDAAGEGSAPEGAAAAGGVAGAGPASGAQAAQDGEEVPDGGNAS